MTALTWAALPESDAATAVAGQPPLQGPQQQRLQPGSSDGCLRLHGQSVGALGLAKRSNGGSVLKNAGFMHLHKTLHDVDLLGVTCLSVKATVPTSPGELLNKKLVNHKSQLLPWQLPA